MAKTLQFPSTYTRVSRVARTKKFSNEVKMATVLLFCCFGFFATMLIEMALHAISKAEVSHEPNRAFLFILGFSVISGVLAGVCVTKFIWTRTHLTFVIGTIGMALSHGIYLSLGFSIDYNPTYGFGLVALIVATVGGSLVVLLDKYNQS